MRVATLLIMLSRKAALSAFSWPQISFSISIMWEIFSSCIYNVTPLGLIRCTTFVWCCSTSLQKAATSSSAELCHFLLGMLENKQVWNVNEQQKFAQQFMRPANITCWRAYSLKNVSFLESGLEIAIKMESSHYMCVSKDWRSLRNRKCNFPLAWFVVSDTCLSNRAKSMCVFLDVRFQSSTHRGRVEVCISCLFWAFGCWCVSFFSFLPQHCLDCQSQLSNTSRLNGRRSSHSLNQPPVACACVDVC